MVFSVHFNENTGLRLTTHHSNHYLFASFCLGIKTQRPTPPLFFVFFPLTFPVTAEERAGRCKGGQGAQEQIQSRARTYSGGAKSGEEKTEKK